MSTDGLSDDLRRTLATLRWDHGDTPFDLTHDMDKAFSRAVSAVNYHVLDELMAWLGLNDFARLLTARASTISQDGLRLAVLRFDLPEYLIGLGLPDDHEWLGQDNPEHDGLRLLQPVERKPGT